MREVAIDKPTQTNSVSLRRGRSEETPRSSSPAHMYACSAVVIERPIILHEIVIKFVRVVVMYGIY